MIGARIRQHYAELSKLSALAKTQGDILEIAKKIRAYNAEHGYKNQQPVVLCLILLSITLGAFCFLVTSSHYAYDNTPYYKTIAYSIFALIVFIFILASRRRKRLKIVKSLVTRSIEIKYSLAPQKFDSRALCKALKNKHPTFKRGNRDKAITQLYHSSTHDGVDFSLCEFQYSVDQTQRDSNNDRRSTYYDAFVLTSIKGFKGIALNTLFYNRSTPYRARWSTGGERFDEYFQVACDNEATAAAFFTHETVTIFEESFRNLKYLEVNDDGDVCMCFDRTILPSFVKVKSIKKNEDFLQQLENPIELPVLDQAKAVIDYISTKVKA